MIVGAHADGRLFSLEAQLGQTLVLILGDGASPGAQAAWADRFTAGAGRLKALEAEAVVLLSMGVSAMTSHLNPPTPGVVITLPDTHLSPLGGQGEVPDILVIDRAGRIVERISQADPERGFAAVLAAATRLQLGPSTVRLFAAPVLMVPNLMDADLCRSLVVAFEAGAHTEGAMASVNEKGEPIARLSDAKKKRRDLLLEADHPLHGPVVDVLGQRLAPELHRAFHLEVAHADRILIARYDHTGGYFHRHRDNAAPHVAFRQFAVSINLNTGDYTGGELEFPEFGPDLYLPPAGAAAVFSASLLHAARPVLTGSRYVLLTFLHDRGAEERRVRASAQVG
jgi:predicted 2-oxoglutarate/Fe(II)-dependent dioxygenase YbiX